jgi:glycosyltransferase involved in cell wall biosynthesis
MGKTPLVSIVLTTLNAAEYLRESVDSCLNQTYQNIELILVDGGSTDETIQILEGYYARKLKIINQSNNYGKLPGAINLGLDQAKGEYLTWMQADSIYHPEAIERMVDCLESHPDVGHVYADYWVIDADGAIQNVVQTCAPEEILKAKSDPCGVCFMIRRTTRDIVGPHDIEAYPTQDYDYRLRIAQKVASFHIQEQLYYWRIHPYSLTGSRPWTVDARNDVKIRQKLGLATPEQAATDLAEIDMSWAFEQYRAGKFHDVPQNVISGIRQHPQYIFNRGVWSIFTRSILKKSPSGKA